MKLKRWEISALVGLAAMLLFTVLPAEPMRWWSAAFAPLCDGILTANGAAGELVLRSKLWELLRALLEAA